MRNLEKQSIEKVTTVGWDSTLRALQSSIIDFMKQHGNESDGAPNKKFLRTIELNIEDKKVLFSFTADTSSKEVTIVIQDIRSKDGTFLDVKDIVSFPNQIIMPGVGKIIIGFSQKAPQDTVNHYDRDQLSDNLLHLLPQLKQQVDQKEYAQ